MVVWDKGESDGGRRKEWNRGRRDEGREEVAGGGVGKESGQVSGKRSER